ncbi:MAG: hypothetical protein O2855_06210 [Planctomycetota bacterium]|nr:hypothetical protein [Planctomycetota bacterium]
MTTFRSFVDLVFVVLCGLVVVLQESVELKGLTVDAVDMLEGVTHDIAMDTPGVLVVGDEWYAANGEHYPALPDAIAAASSASSGEVIVVVPVDEKISHERVLSTWFAVTQSGHRAELGVTAEPSL